MAKGGNGNRPKKGNSLMRALTWARDLYESSLMGCARGSAGRAMPRSRSHGAFLGAAGSAAVGSSDADIAELIRAASHRANLAILGVKDGMVVPRSQSVVVASTKTATPAIGRIDEEGSCDFDDAAAAAAVVVPRSKSCAVVPQRRVRIAG